MEEQPRPSQPVPEAPKNNLQKRLIFIFVAFFVGIGSFLVYVSKKQPSVTTIIPTQPTQPPPSPTIDGDVNWKSYTNTKFTVQYPNNFYMYTYPSGSYSRSDLIPPVSFSDIANPTDIPLKVAPEGHTIISVNYVSGTVPKSFPYTNGSDKNDTIKPYSLNGYTGIIGNQTSTVDLETAVYLQVNTKEYIILTLQLGDKKIFEEMLSTLILSSPLKSNP